MSDSERKNRSEPQLASPEIVEYLKTHVCSCRECGLTLSGWRGANCPACGWLLDLPTLIERERTVAKIVRNSDWLCPSCHYNLRGTSGDTCPECGHRLTAATLVDPAVRPGGIRRPKTTALVLGLTAGGLFATIAWNFLRAFTPYPPLTWLILPALGGLVIGLWIYWSLSVQARRVGKRR